MATTAMTSVMADARSRPRPDLLAKLVLFLSTTESRSKVYRVCQYGAKSARWALTQTWHLEPRQSPHQVSTAAAAPPRADHAAHPTETTDKPAKSYAGEASPRSPPSSCADPTNHDDSDDAHSQRRHAVVAALSRVELLFGDARKVYRLLQFLEMADMFRNVTEELRVVRVLRRLRVACFFLFYVLENWMLFQLRVRGLPARDPRVKLLKRGLNGFWCLSILLAFPIDRLTGRDGALSTLKKLLDLPVAYVAFSDQRVSDGLFGALGLASGNIGVYLRWVDVTRKLPVAARS